MEDHKLKFLTAWAAPHPILQKLSEMYPDIKFKHEWADEDIGSNCGRYVYYDGECVEEYFPESQRESLEFAARVMDVLLPYNNTTFFIHNCNDVKQTYE